METPYINVPDTTDVNGHGFCVHIVLLGECNIIEYKNIILPSDSIIRDEA